MKKADWQLLLVAMIWGGGFVAGKAALGAMSPQGVLFFRFAASMLAVGLIFRRQIRSCGKGCALWGLLLGLLQYGGLFLQLFALQYTTPAKQSFLAATYVLFTPFAAWVLLRRRPRPRDYLAAVLTVAGIGLLSLRPGQPVQIGDFITLGFSVLFSVQLVLTGQLTQTLPAMALTFYQLVGATVLSGCVVLVTGFSFGQPDAVSLGALAYLSLINTAAALCIQNHAQKRTTASRAALLLSLESVFGLGFSILFYHDSVTVPMLIGCALIGAALVISNRAPKPAQAQTP